MANVAVDFCGMHLKNPILCASGTFCARESSQFYDPSILGAVISKGVSLKAKEGNPLPRIAESYGGMLNAVGLQNPGVEAFIKGELSNLYECNDNVIVNVCANTIDEYCAVVERLNDEALDAFEINISCPNVKKGGIGFGCDVSLAESVTKAVKKVSKKPIIVKLTPNVTNIAVIAKACEAAGADAVSLINTVLAMKIDIYKKKSVLANITGGLSGPAIKPLAVRMVYEVKKAVSIPILGGGGIMNYEDAVEFIMAGASCLSVGTAALVNPLCMESIIKDLNGYMDENGFSSIGEIRESFVQNMEALYGL